MTCRQNVIGNNVQESYFPFCIIDTFLLFNSLKLIINNWTILVLMGHCFRDIILPDSSMCFNNGKSFWCTAFCNEKNLNIYGDVQDVTDLKITYVELNTIAQ